MLWLLIVTGILCLISGFILSLPFLIEQNVPLHGVKDITDKFKIFIAIANIIIAIINLFSLNYYIQFFIGNLLPALALLVSGLGLTDRLLRFINFSEDPEKSNQVKEKVTGFIKKSSILIGILTFIIGILHFFLGGWVIF